MPQSNADQSAATRTREARTFIRQVRAASRSKYTPKEEICIVLGIFTWLLVSLAASFSLASRSTTLWYMMSVAGGLRGRVMSIYHLDHGLTPSPACWWG